VAVLDFVDMTVNATSVQSVVQNLFTKVISIRQNSEGHPSP